MQDLLKQAHKAALGGLLRKMRNQEFDQNIKVISKPMSTGGLNYNLLHPDYMKNPLKAVRIKYNNMTKE